MVPTVHVQSHVHSNKQIGHGCHWIPWIQLITEYLKFMPTNGMDHPPHPLDALQARIYCTSINTSPFSAILWYSTESTVGGPFISCCTYSSALDGIRWCWFRHDLKVLTVGGVRGVRWDHHVGSHSWIREFYYPMETAFQSNKSWKQTISMLLPVSFPRVRRLLVHTVCLKLTPLYSIAQMEVRRCYHPFGFERTNVVIKLPDLLVSVFILMTVLSDINSVSPWLFASFELNECASFRLLITARGNRLSNHPTKADSGLPSIEPALQTLLLLVLRHVEHYSTFRAYNERNWRRRQTLRSTNHEPGCLDNQE